ncbi:hypothetical protein GXW83_17200 [Streptacidiphilus sp. PB12-B1b]|uniref:hypothetical protein n=1 Tax=Streptacidiphilus sp. PB12-B1b TaxID=2705012 RepID=UPI0015F7FBF8|nr:hypothetical protein [Streptacidiphilus sp. PB12-B1b]QMU77184.1 hypothetical protein GXW83_17200 [Streptacidiphilus sp. PB12-B1b]
MIIILGLILLVAAAVVALVGIFSNTGSAHALSHFSIFGQHMTGSTGALFLFGIIVGAVAMLGLGLMLTGARRTSRRAGEARHSLHRSRRETAATHRNHDDLVDQRDTAQAEAASAAEERDHLAGQRDDLISQQELLRTQPSGPLEGRAAQTAGEQTGSDQALQTDDEPASTDNPRRPNRWHRFAH